MSFMFTAAVLDLIQGVGASRSQSGRKIDFRNQLAPEVEPDLVGIVLRSEVLQQFLFLRFHSNIRFLNFQHFDARDPCRRIRSSNFSEFILP